MTTYQKSYGRYHTTPDLTRCCENVADGFWSKQCSKPCGYGPEKAYCKVHDPEAVKARRDKATAEYKAQLAIDRVKWAGPKFLEALRQIAAGHNDPRALAEEVIKEFEKR